MYYIFYTMKQRIYYVFIILLILIGCSETNNKNNQDATIFPKGVKIDNDNFNGNAWLTMLAEPDSLNQMYAGNVRFEAGVRTNWHLHPGGQILIVTDGKGYYQEQGKPKHILLKGDAVKCPPNVRHWHGASPKSEFSHIAISTGQNGTTQWFQPVSEDDYHNN